MTLAVQSNILVCSEYGLFLCVIRLLLELSYGCQLASWFSLLKALSLGFPTAPTISVLGKLMYVGALQLSTLSNKLMKMQGM